MSVVIPHKGNFDDLMNCVLALRAQSYPSSKTTITVAINSEPDSIPAFKTMDNERIVWQPKYFSYAARNLGVQQSKGKIIAFTDSDATPSIDWIEQGVTALESNSADIIAGQINVTTGGFHKSAPALFELMFAFDQEKNVLGGFSTTANLFVKRSAFVVHGLFDETAQTGEDFEWTRAAVDGGARLAYAPLVVVTHPARESWPKLFDKARRTTLPYVGVGASSASGNINLQRRLMFHVKAQPSRSKTEGLTSPQRTIARLVRLVLIAYKAFCLLGLSPAFRRDLERARSAQTTIVLAPKGAGA